MVQKVAELEAQFSLMMSTGAGTSSASNIRIGWDFWNNLFFFSTAISFVLFLMVICNNMALLPSAWAVFYVAVTCSPFFIWVLPNTIIGVYFYTDYSSEGEAGTLSK